MKNELSQTEEFSLDNKPPADTPASRGRRAGRRRSSQPSVSGGPVRFFLSKPGSNGTPQLDEELQSEGEAMLESLKTGRSYFLISEWKGAADLSKKIPQIRKECITAKKAS
jgi:hypothetical protein